jgi:hypothetical protein
VITMPDSAIAAAAGKMSKVPTKIWNSATKP